MIKKSSKTKDNIFVRYIMSYIKSWYPSSIEFAKYTLSTLILLWWTLTVVVKFDLADVAEAVEAAEAGNFEAATVAIAPAMAPAAAIRLPLQLELDVRC